MQPSPHEITELIQKANAGSPEAVSLLFEKIYDTLRSIAGAYMRRERAGHILQATAVVNEAYLRLFGNEPVRVDDRIQFFQAAAGAMRRVLIDNARAKRALKRGGGAQVTLREWMAVLDEPLDDRLDFDAALRRLGKLDQRQETIMNLFIYAGRSAEEIASLLGVAKRTVERDISSACVFLRQELRRGGNDARALAKD
jgi:RNA polymerase sigma factor (TIGR02999 family)